MIKKRLTKGTVILLCVILSVCVAAGTTLAFIFAKAPSVTNEFEPVFVSCSVEESFANNVKSNVKVKNTGDIAAYIRAYVVINWVSEEDGSINGTSPVKDADYTITYSGDWILGSDGFYYFADPISPNAATDILIERASLSPNAEAPEGYVLSVQIIASAIQAQPAEAVYSAWGATVTNGRLTPA